MGSGRRNARPDVDVSLENAAAQYSLGRAVYSDHGGIYFLIGSPRAQAAAIGQFAGENLGIHDFSGENRKLTAIADLLDSEPDRRAYVFLNFQLALWDGKGWNHDAVRRLNFSRNGLAARGKILIFCMTADADAEISRHALDFYDYIKLFFRFQDEPAAPTPAPAAIPTDQSTGIEVPTVDFSRPEEELLGLAIALGHRADELVDKAQYADALKLLEVQREIRERLLGTEDPDTAMTYNNIGYVYGEQGDYVRQMEWYLKALRIKEKVLGTEHPDTATSYNNIGYVYHSQGDYARALEWYFKALRIREKVLGTEHPDTAVSYNNIGGVYDLQGDYARALEYYLKALQIREKALGTEHPDTAQSYNNIGLVYRAQGDYARALEYYLKALQIVENVLGTDHPDTAIDYHNIGAVYFERGDYKTALEWLDKALKIEEKVLGAEHPHTKTTRAWIRGAQQHLK